MPGINVLSFHKDVDKLDCRLGYVAGLYHMHDIAFYIGLLIGFITNIFRDFFVKQKVANFGPSS